MYFTAETQAQMLRRFHFALDDDGILLLGKSEMLITHADLFTPVDLKWRVFRKVIRQTFRDRVRVMAVDPGNGASLSVTDNLREAAFDISGAGQVVLDANGALVMANDTARRMFNLGFAEFGRLIKDLELSYRPLELRSHLDALAKDRRAIEIKGSRWRFGDQERILDVRLAPLMDDGRVLGTSITYVDITDSQHLRDELQSSQHELEGAYEELQSTVEELETTNEELQSTNEELETTNEELQSTNEELETTNEELQSSNEELETMNSELRSRTLELNDMNAFLETILTTVGLAVAVVDRRQHVQIWNGQARELWGLTSDEVVDQHLMTLDFGLPVEQLKAGLRSCLAGESEREELMLEATNRRGQRFRCQVVTMPLGNHSDGNRSDGNRPDGNRPDGNRSDGNRSDGSVSGAVILMEPTD
jgi:two-component system CheB/CheR fusion protein